MLRSSLLVDQLTAYETDTNPLYYAMRFMDGLRDEVKSMVMIQRPRNLDEACALTLVQEAVDFGRKREYRRFDSSSSRSYQKSGFLALPPSRRDKSFNSSVVEEAKPTEAVRPNTDDKLRALKQYRRAKGLCDRCAEKWIPGHHCASTVQLHAIQELWELMSDEDSLDTYSVSFADDQSAQICVVVSKAAVSGIESPRSMRLMGSIQGHDMLILVDSGSSHSFLSSKLVGQLSGASKLINPMTVTGANGAPILCSI
jgi:hypothetical protein